MDRAAKPIYLTWHAEQWLRARGTTLDEIVDAIRTADWAPADHGRLQCRRNYPHEAFRDGVYYGTKQVRPIFVDEAHEIVVITVYTYFF